jgi:hypothetical protein
MTGPPGPRAVRPTGSDAAQRRDAARRLRTLHQRLGRSEPNGGLWCDLSIRLAELRLEDASCQPAGSAEASAAFAEARALLNDLAQQAPRFRADQVQQLRAVLPPG